MNNLKTKSKSEIYKTIRGRIAFLEYQPGEALREGELVDEFGCSRTPIREAFIRLNDEGLVNIIPQSGTYVSEVNFKDLKENYKVRKYLIKLAGELAAENATSEEINRMENLLEEMKQQTDPEELIRMDIEFHRLVNEATHNSVLKNILDSLEIQAVRIWLFSGDRSFLSQFVNDFSHFIDNIKKSDRQKCVQILEGHVQQTIEHIQDELRKL